jgi:hypothetical protein
MMWNAMVRVMAVSFFCSAFAYWDAGAADIEGVAEVAGPDAVRLHGEVYFLAGMAVPAELEVISAVSVKSSRAYLATLLSGQKTLCSVQSRSQGSHATARCRAGGVDLAEAMIRSGHGLAYNESGVNYSQVQKAAQDQKRGLWASAGPDVSTDTVELASRLASGAVAPRDCVIKGNRGQSKPYALKYHLPDAPYYTRTRINLNQHENWFCSEATAREAGFAAAN